MRLADFIERNIARIVDDAESFATTVGAVGGRLDSEALRDHIPDILQVIVADMRTSQSAEHARSKSEGRYPPASDVNRTAAQTHAGMRADHGFDIVQMVSEYRVLRASVLRLWAEQSSPDEYALEDIHRFNEAVDQAVAESVSYFARQVERWRNVFLGVLGHELRGPLQAILMATELLQNMGMDQPVSKNVERIIDGGQRMRALLDDLLDFNRTSFGQGLLITRREVDLAAACERELELVRLTQPHHEITFSSSGPTTGSFDESRVREVVWNLVTNAAKYGRRDAPIQVTLSGAEDEVRLQVANSGPDISVPQLTELFEPLRRASTDNELTASLGLGLFVVRQVAIAHGGEVAVESAGGRTAFSVTLHKEFGRQHAA